eukprot:Hpha_TRINITY_DN384_c0_g1::TRINITY_DN384_c0_g1_i1::g.112593::m.112593
MALEAIGRKLSETLSGSNKQSESWSGMQEPLDDGSIEMQQIVAAGQDDAPLEGLTRATPTGPGPAPAPRSPAESVLEWNSSDIAEWLASEGLSDLAGVLSGVDRGIELLSLTRQDLVTTPLFPGRSFDAAQLGSLWDALQRLRIRERDVILSAMHTRQGSPSKRKHSHGLPPGVAERLPRRLSLPQASKQETKCCDPERRGAELFLLRHFVVGVLLVLVLLGFESRESEWRTYGRTRVRVHETESAFMGDIYSVSADRPLYLNLTDELPQDFVTVLLFVPPVGYEVEALLGNVTATGAAQGKPPSINVTLEAYGDGVWSPVEDSQTLATLRDKPSRMKHRFRGTPFDIPSRVALRPTKVARGRAAFAHIPVKVRVLQHPKLVEYGAWIGAAILCLMYLVIFMDWVPKMVVACGASFAAVAACCYLYERYDLVDLIGWIDIETVGLLFGMMVMVGLLANTGFFEWAAARGYRLSGGDTWRLVVILCLFTAVVSAVLDNVTTVLLVAPVTLRLCRVLGIPPQPVLMAEVLFSNIGGTLTPIGDPPNVIIANNEAVRAHGITFLSFTGHMLAGVVGAGVAALWVVKKLMRAKLLQTNSQMQLLLNEKALYEGFVEDLVGTTADILAPKMFFLQRIAEIDAEAQDLEAPESTLQSFLSPTTPQTFDDAVIVDQTVPSVACSKPSFGELEELYKITDRTLLKQCIVVIGSVVTLFFLRSVMDLAISIAMISILGAVALIAISGKGVEPVLHKVEWPTLMFFAALFVLMRALEEMGLIEALTEVISSAVKASPSGSQTAVAVLLVLWVSALVSAFIDNIPFTTAMVPVIVDMAEDPALNVTLKPLVWALAFGTCLGGNGTLIGASANVVVAGLADQDGHPITFNAFFRIGFPVMLATVVVATLYLLLLVLIS